MILLDILNTYTTIITYFNSDPLADATQVFAVAIGLTVAWQTVKKLSSMF